MEVKIIRSEKTAKWQFMIDDKLITEQTTMTKLLLKAYKYIKSQGI